MKLIHECIVTAELLMTGRLQAETTHPWTGKQYFGKLLYLMRHTQQHIGDMNRVLRICDCEALDWK